MQQTKNTANPATATALLRLIAPKLDGAIFSFLVLSCSCSSFFFSKEKEKEQQEEITKTIEEEEEEETLVLVVTAESVLRIVARSACHRFTRPLVSNQRGVNSEPVSKSRSCVNPLPESLTFSAAVI